MQNSSILVNKIYQGTVERQHADIRLWQQAMNYASQISNERRQPLVDLYKNALLDTHLSGIIARRKSTVLNTNIACGKNGQENELMTALMNKPAGQALVSEILNTLFYGHTLLELSFTKRDFQAKLIPRRYVLPQLGRVILDLSNYDNYIDFRSEAYQDRLIELNAEDNLGLFCKVVPMVIYKRNCLGDFAQYAELFGQPIRKISYDPQDPNSYDEALKRIGTTDGGSLVILLPKNTEIEFIESTSKDGSLSVYQSLIQITNSEMSKVILGNTLTTEQGERGARSLGEIHKNSEEQLILHDRIFVLNALNYELKPRLIKQGLPIKENEEFYFKEVEEIDLNQRIIIDSQLNSLIPIPSSYFYETYGIPQPKVAEKKRETPTGEIPKTNENSEQEQAKPEREKLSMWRIMRELLRPF